MVKAPGTIPTRGRAVALDFTLKTLIARSRTRRARQEVAMKKLIVAFVALTVVHQVAAAQDVLRPEIRPFAGAYIPAGVQRNLFREAPMFGVQAALEFRPTFHLLGTFGWVPGEAKYTGADADVNIFQYDIGIELNAVQPLRDAWLFKPFIGLGGGARSYLYSDAQLKDRTCAAGYGAVGVELEVNRTALRLEGRDNVFCFRSALDGIKSRTRSDFGLSLGLAYHFR